MGSILATIGGIIAIIKGTRIREIYWRGRYGIKLILTIPIKGLKLILLK